MRWSPKAISRPPRIRGAARVASACLALALALGGCGSSTAGGKAEVAIPLTSTAFEGGKLPARFTCDGANISPPLRWGSVPSASAEVVLFAIGKPASASTHVSSTIEWAMAGIKPGLHELKAGEVPHGAFLEQASDGKRQYSICPARGQTRFYAFAVYALPEKVKVTPKINGAALFHNLAEGPPKFRAPGSGAFTVTYTRK